MPPSPVRTRSGGAPPPPLSPPPGRGGRDVDLDSGPDREADAEADRPAGLARLQHDAIAGGPLGDAQAAVSDPQAVRLDAHADLGAIPGLDFDARILHPQHERGMVAD